MATPIRYDMAPAAWIRRDCHHVIGRLAHKGSNERGEIVLANLKGEDRDLIGRMDNFLSHLENVTVTPLHRGVYRHQDTLEVHV
jgi:hypothetical protein